MNKNEDNPVPSIDKKDIKYIIELIKRDKSFGVNQSYQIRYKNGLIKTLQNGVETDKEKPIIECTCKNEFDWV